MKYVFVPIIVATVFSFGLLISGPRAAEASEWWTPTKYEKWNCCGDVPVSYENKQSPDNENEQVVEINQICENVLNCTVDSGVLNDQKATSDQEFTDKSQDKYTTKGNEFKGEYDKLDHNGIYNIHGLSDSQLEDYQKNGLQVDISLTNSKYQGPVQIIASSDYYTEGEKLTVPYEGPATYNYWYKPGLVGIGEPFYICVKNLYSGEKNCGSGINHKEKQPEQIALTVPT